MSDFCCHLCAANYQFVEAQKKLSLAREAKSLTAKKVEMAQFLSVDHGILTFSCCSFCEFLFFDGDLIVI